MNDDVPWYVTVVLILMLVAWLVSCGVGHVLDNRAVTLCKANGYDDGEGFGLDAVICKNKFMLDTNYTLIETEQQP